MQTTMPLITLVLLSAFPARAQTADEYVAQGREYMASSNLLAANTSFSNAVVLAPANPTANALYGITRVLAWPNEPAGSNFLTRFGLPAQGRNIYDWTTRLPRDTNGVPLAPSGVSAAEVTAMVRTNLLAELLGAEANLVQVSDTNFTLVLTAAETQGLGVTLDYGDILMLRAMLQGTAWFAYTLNSWNLDAQLTAVRGLYNSASRRLDLGTLLSEYPDLLTFATTNDLASGRAAFTNAIGLYLEASAWIRNRPADVVCLFNLDPSKENKERNFRLTLEDLRASLDGAVPLRINPGYTVFLAPQFEGMHTVRSFLPPLNGAQFVLGSLPDLTFGGIVFGARRSDIEPFFANFLAPIPRLGAWQNSGWPFGFTVDTLRGRGYVVQASSNLVTWVDAEVFVALGETHTFVDPALQPLPRRFYRVVDRPFSSLPPPSNDNFSHSRLLSGVGIEATGYNVNATIEPGEPGYTWNTVWYTWTAPVTGVVVVGTIGSDAWKSVNVYEGFSLINLGPVGYDWNPGQSYNGFSFRAITGTTYYIQVGGPAGAFQLQITFPPNLIVTSPLDGSVSLIPTNFPITAFSSDDDGNIAGMSCSADGQPLGGTTSASLDLLWTNVGAGVHFIQVAATDNLGITTYEQVEVTVRPANDEFSNAVPIPGTEAVLTGSNSGATKEPGEPDHGGLPGGASVWWSWTAPSSGITTISADVLSPYDYPFTALLGVYTGNVVSNLISIAGDFPAHGYGAQVTFFANAGVTYRIAVDSAYGDEGNIILRLTPDQPPLVEILSPTNGAVFFASGPTNITITANATDADGSITQMDFYADGGYQPFKTLGSAPYSFIWSNVPPNTYELVAKATDNQGITTFSDSVYFLIQPPPPANDDFANRTPLVGAPVSVSGSNAGATREPDEPYHDGNYGGSSVWWAWTAPYSGWFSVAVSSSTVNLPILAVYSGNDLVNLAEVASTTGVWYGAQLSFYAIGGVTYPLVLDDYYGIGGDYLLEITPQ